MAVVVVESNVYGTPELTNLGSGALNFSYKNRDAPQTLDAYDKDIFPCLRPDSGFWFSNVKWWRFGCDVAPVTQITNFKIWQSASPPTGCEVFITQGGTYQVISSGTELTTIPGSPSPSALTIMTGNYTSSGSALSVGGTLTDTASYSNYISHCLRVAPTASLGTLAGSWTLSYSWDGS